MVVSFPLGIKTEGRIKARARKLPKKGQTGRSQLRHGHS